MPESDCQLGTDTFSDGEEVFAAAENGDREVARKGMPAQAVKKVSESGGILGRNQRLRHRLETFATGACPGGLVDPRGGGTKDHIDLKLCGSTGASNAESPEKPVR
jgi:hypothetical protein